MSLEIPFYNDYVCVTHLIAHGLISEKRGCSYIKGTPVWGPYFIPQKKHNGFPLCFLLCSFFVVGFCGGIFVTEE